METNTSSKLTIVVATAMFIGGMILGFIVGAGQAGSEIEKLQAKIDTAKKFFPQVLEIHSISGKVKSISNDIVTIESSLDVNPLEDFPKERMVTITSATKLVSFVQKDSMIFQKEMEEFSKKMSTAPRGSISVPSPLPPTPFTEKESSLSDLKEGMTINVEASENIKEKVTFVAVKIILMPQAPQVKAQ